MMRSKILLFETGGPLRRCVLCGDQYLWGGPATHHAKAHERRREAHYEIAPDSWDAIWYVSESKHEAE